MAKFEYKSWKLHFAIVNLSIFVAAVIVIIRTLIFGFDPFWLLFIPFIPVAVYMTLLSLGLAVSVGGLGFIGFVGWRVLKYLYNEINIETDIDRDFYWPEYFWLAFCWLSLGLFTVLVTIIIIGGVHKLITIGRFLFQLKLYALCQS